jgi:hypothetical protein
MRGVREVEVRAQIKCITSALPGHQKSSVTHAQLRARDCDHGCDNAVLGLEVVLVCRLGGEFQRVTDREQRDHVWCHQGPQSPFIPRFPCL